MHPLRRGSARTSAVSRPSPHARQAALGTRGRTGSRTSLASISVQIIDVVFASMLDMLEDPVD